MIGDCSGSLSAVFSKFFYIYLFILRLKTFLCFFIFYHIFYGAYFAHKINFLRAFGSYLPNCLDSFSQKGNCRLYWPFSHCTPEGTESEVNQAKFFAIDCRCSLSSNKEKNNEIESPLKNLSIKKSTDANLFVFNILLTNSTTQTHCSIILSSNDSRIMGNCNSRWEIEFFIFYIVIHFAIRSEKSESIVMLISNLKLASH